MPFIVAAIRHYAITVTPLAIRFSLRYEFIYHYRHADVAATYAIFGCLRYAAAERYAECADAVTLFTILHACRHYIAARFATYAADFATGYIPPPPRLRH